MDTDEAEDRASNSHSNLEHVIAQVPIHDASAVVATDASLSAAAGSSDCSTNIAMRQ